MVSSSKPFHNTNSLLFSFIQLSLRSNVKHDYKTVLALFCGWCNRFQKSLRLLTTDGTSLWFHSSPSLLIYQIEYIKERRSFPSMHMFRKSVNSCILYALKLLLNQCMQNYYPCYATLQNSIQNARLALFIDNARSVTIQIVHFMSKAICMFLFFIISCFLYSKP